MELAEQFYNLFEGNKRAYGFQMQLDRPQGRPRVRALKVGASEAFRSTNEAK
jgi:hypothetical protein